MAHQVYKLLFIGKINKAFFINVGYNSTDRCLTDKGLNITFTRTTAPVTSHQINTLLDVRLSIDISEIIDIITSIIPDDMEPEVQVCYIIFNFAYIISES